jgi:phosphomannomutase/phosphoglucomutase
VWAIPKSGTEIMINPTIFREYDIRGINGKDLSPDLAFRIGRAYASLAKTRLGKTKAKIAVGRDCRTSGIELSRALASGLISGSFEVVDLGMVTTPMTYFSLHQAGFDGSIMVTGSHNPPNYNGFKICVGKGTLYGKDIQELKNLILSDTSPSLPLTRTLETMDIASQYEKYLLAHTRLSRPMKIVVDAGNGAAGPYAPEIYRKMGCEVIELFCEPDGNFPNHEADPTVEKNLQDMIRAVKKHGADAGIAFDGDADRIGVVDEKGTILWGDELMVVFSRDILREKPGATIISEVKSSNRLYQDIAKRGGKPIMWKTGHSLIKAKIKETHAALAGEMSGHIFFADRYFGYDDAIYAGARFLEIASRIHEPVSSLLADLPKSFSTPEIRVDCDDLVKFKLVESLKSELKKSHEINDIDGVRVNFGNAWALVRASNTQPVIVMRFEADSQERLDEVRSLIEDASRRAGLVI